MRDGTTMDAPAIESWSIDYVSRILNIQKSQVDPHLEVDRFGLDSATAAALIMELEDRLGIELAPELLFEYPTLAGLSRHLATLLPLAAEVA